MKSRVRSMLLFWILAIGFLGVIFRAVQIQVKPDQRLQKFSANKEKLSVQSQSEEFITSRGAIVDRNGRELALSIVTKSYFANPKLIKDPAKTAKRLSPILKMPAVRLQELLNQDRFFVWLKREVDEDVARKIDDLEIDGIYSRKESKRVYPQGELAKAIIGVAGRDGQGLEGVEKSFNQYLKSADEGKSLGFKDALGRLLLFRDFEKEWFESPHVILTLDARLQRIVEEELRATLREKRAQSAQAIMMDPRSGEIMAMASLDGERSDANPLRNRVVSDLYEPGSTFKVILAAAALEHLGMTASSQIFGENGLFHVGNRTIREFHGKKYQWLSLQELLEISSNIASAKIGLKLGPEKFFETIEKFGLSKSTGIDLPGEASSWIRKPSDWKPIETANISFGQGLAITPLQMVRAVAAIANGGVLTTPHLISKVMAPKSHPADSKILWQPDLTSTEIYSSEKARALTDMLIHVTEAGSTGSAAAVEGYQVAGKTGTAQKLVEKPNAKGKMIKTYSLDQSIVSFVGYVPAYDPAFVLLIIYDDPKGRASGGNTAAPAFRRIASRALGVLGVSPRRPTSDKEMASANASRQVEGTRFVGKSFRVVLKEIQNLPTDQRAKVDLVGYGTAVREELKDDDRLVVYFE